MTKKLTLALVLGISSLQLANAPIKILNEERMKKIPLEVRINQPEKKFIKEIKRILKEQIEYDKTYEIDDFSKDREEILLARMLLGEVEGCSKIEKIAVTYSVINRMNKNPIRYGATIKEVILKPLQYSAFNEDQNQKLKKPLDYNKKEFISNIQLVRNILSGKYSDPTGGATYYLNPDHPNLKRKLPIWTKELKKIGRIKNSYHIFYKE